jgi:hypothetical protein
LALSVLVSVQYWLLVPALQSDWPERQKGAQVPDWHDWASVHVVPQPPQLALSELVSAQKLAPAMVVHAS